VPPHTKVPSAIAVLPILDQTPGHHRQQLNNDVTEALITEMRQRNWPHWHIRSVIINGDPALPQQQADAVFSGSVSVNGGILRVTGSLEHLPSKIVLWNGAVERKLAEWPESEHALLFEDIAFAIAESLNTALMERQEEEMAAVYPRRVEARHAWLEADELWRRGDADSVRRAVGLLEKAIALDPNFAWIHASLAFAYVRAVELGFAPEATYRRRSHEQVARALELGPYLAPANAAAVRVSLALDWNIQAASATCMSALNMLSASYSVRDQCAEMYSLDGRNEVAAALELRSIRRTTTKTIPLTELAWVRYRSRQFEEAQSLAEQALSLDKGYVPARRA
jgi:TolB-like protein